MGELETKLDRIRELLDRHSAGALLLRRVDNFAWATCGAASYVNEAAAEGGASLLITGDAMHLVTDNIEAPRLEQEEQLATQGWEFHVAPWYESTQAIDKLAHGLKLAADVNHDGALNLSSELVPLRAQLAPEETERFRPLGGACAEAMDATIRTIRPGLTEHEMAAELDRQVRRRGIQPIVILVAVDERIYRFRHPLPTSKRLDCYAMLVLCGRQYGLVCSITRLVHFGALPAELRRRAEAVARVDARFLRESRPGKTLGEIFSAGVQAYGDAGFADEWRLHHQGGLAGYAPREIIATAETKIKVSEGQACAWNPSITGAKSEDTVLIGREGNEVITKVSGWPSIAVEVDGATVERPAILELT